MPRTVPRPLPPNRASRQLRLGYVPLNDAAPLIVAQEQGLFARQGLSVRLSRELGWATVRDKVVYGELDAAHALAGLLVSTKLGLGSPAFDCLTACILSVQGNAITLAERYWQEGVRDAATLRDAIVRCRHERPLVLGVVYPFSTHHLHLSDWLRAGGINPQRDVRIVVVPPPQMYRNLAAGNIDGYCVGEPWTSLAIQGAVGWCAAVSRDLHPGHPEKVLMVGEPFAATRPDEHLALVAALTEAAAWCDDPDFRPELSRLLARREYLNLPVSVIAAGLTGRFDLGHGISCDASTLVTFHSLGANDPQPAKAEWLIDGFRRQGLVAPGVTIPPSLSRELFRSDLFHQACHHHLPHASLTPALP